MQSGQQLPPPPEPRPAVRFSRPVTTGETVTVACKLPNGILLRIFRQHHYEEPQQNGTHKTVMEWRPVPNRQFAVRGTWAGSAGQAYNRGNSAVAELLPGGFALTYGVPKDLWDQWYDQNRNTSLVTKGIIFATPSVQGSTIEAKNNRAVQSGLEPVDPDNPAQRMPGGIDRRLKVSMLQEGEPGTSPR